MKAYFNRASYLRRLFSRWLGVPPVPNERCLAGRGRRAPGPLNDTQSSSSGGVGWCVCFYPCSFSNLKYDTVTYAVSASS